MTEAPLPTRLALPRSSPASPAAALFFSLPFLLAAPARADRLELKDGSELRGRVVDLGGNSVEVHLRASSSSRRIFLRDIRKAEFDLEAEARTPDADLVFRNDGSELWGDVKLSEDGKSVVVSRGDGSQVSIPRDAVSRIVYRDQARAESGAVYTARVRDEVQASLAALAGPEEGARAAEEKLKSYGIFAIGAVEAALRTARPGTASHQALGRVLRLYRIREITPDPLQELSDYYRILSDGTLAEKRGLLEEMFTRYVEESAPVARFLIRDRDEDPHVRSWAVDLLGRMERNRDLVEIFNDPQGGQVQLAAAVALARNRLLVGAEALIQALEMERVEVRELAIRTLKAAVGKDFRYSAQDTPTARKEAIARWKAWWTENRSALKAQAQSILSGRRESEESPERKRAVQLWKNGCLAWEGKKLSQAESALRAAVAADPTFASAQVSLGVFLSQSRERGEEGRRILEDLLTRRLPEMGPGDTTWVYYSLGQAWELAGDLDRSEVEYRRVLGIEPSFFRAAAALGDLKFRRATGSEGGTVEERRRLLGEAEGQYRTAITLIESQNIALETLQVSDLPVENVPPFERQEHNRTVLQVKASLRLRKAELLFGMGKIRSLLEDRKRALSELTSAIEGLGDDRERGARELLVNLRNYRAFLEEAEGDARAALQDYRTVLKPDLDPKNATALEGSRRLRARVGPDSPAPPPGAPAPRRKPTARKGAAPRAANG